MDATLTDGEVIQRIGFADGVPAPLVDDLFPALAGTVGDIVESVPRHGADMAVTPDLVDWLGMDFFRLGAAHVVDRDYLVSATLTVLEVANPDSDAGVPVRQRLAQVNKESRAAINDSITARLVTDPAVAAGTVAHLLFARGGDLWVAQGSQPGQPPAVRKFVRALRKLFLACDPTSPDLPLLARRIGVLADAAEGTLPATEGTGTD